MVMHLKIEKLPLYLAEHASLRAHLSLMIQSCTCTMTYVNCNFTVFKIIILQRKFEVLELDEEVQAAITETEVLWRANFQKFVHCLEKKVSIKLFFGFALFSSIPNM